MGALHDVNANYYGTDESTGHPANALGYALGVGLKLNSPMIGKGEGDYLLTQFTYAHGASRYAYTYSASRYANHVVTGSYGIYNGDNVGFGILTDGVYGGSVTGANTSNVELTNSWIVNAGYEHFWNRAWSTRVW